MKTLRQLRAREYTNHCEITLKELKSILLNWYYENLYKRRPDLYEKDMERELIITEIKGCYGTTSSVVFSVNGSHPKGEAILFLQSISYDERWRGKLVCMGNGKVSKPIDMVKIKKDDSDGRNQSTTN